MVANSLSFSVAQICHQYHHHAALTKAATTAKSYLSHARRFAAYWDLPAHQLTRQHIQAWARQRSETASDATIKHELAFLRAAYNHAADLGQLERNPVTRLGLKLRPTRRHQWLTQAQERTIHRTYQRLWPDRGDLLWTVERFAILTGLRQGEQAWLRPEHLQGQLLQVPSEGKTGARLVPLHPEAAAIAELWCDISRAFKSGFVFWPDTKKRGWPRAKLAYHHARQIWDRARAEHGLPFQRRDLRRTYGSRLVANGVPIYEVQILLGHTTTVQTQTYCRVGEAQLREAVFALE